MKKLLLASAALIGLSVGQAHALNLVVNGTSTPEGLGFNSVITNAAGADTPYSYYTGPIGFSVLNSNPIMVYCVDLNHTLHTGTYTLGVLNKNGEGQTITEFDSNRIGHIANIGYQAFVHGNDVLAVAAQAAIWDISYDGDGSSSTSANPFIQTQINTLLGDGFADTGYAKALIPFGEGWYQNAGANQAMVLASGVPELSSWLMAITGFALVGLVGAHRTRAARRTVEA